MGHGDADQLLAKKTVPNPKPETVDSHAMIDKIDIKKIIRLVREQEPDREDIITSLQSCKGGHWSSKGYYQFVDSRNPNQAGSEWQHDDCIVIEQENEGDIVIDLLKDGRIGGIEFTALIDK